MFEKYVYKLETETNTPLGQLVTKNVRAKPIELDRDLANLLGIERKLKLILIRDMAYISNFILHSL